MLMSNGQMGDPDNWYTKRSNELRGKSSAGAEVERQIIKYNVTGRLYVDSEKRIVLPSEMFASALRKGASNVSVRDGRKWWAGITVMEDAALEIDDLPAWDELHEHDKFVHRCIARVARGAPQPRYRPYFKVWFAQVAVEIDTSALDRRKLETIFTATGLRVGLGDWRPSSPKNPGKYGRFAVTQIVERSQEVPLAA